MDDLQVEIYKKTKEETNNPEEEEEEEEEQEQEQEEEGHTSTCHGFKQSSLRHPTFLGGSMRVCAQKKSAFQMGPVSHLRTASGYFVIALLPFFLKN